MAVAVRILHPALAADGGPLTRLLADERQALAERHAAAFRMVGADDIAIVSEAPDDTPFGARLRRLAAAAGADGLVVLGSGALPLATRRDLAAFVAAAAAAERVALANNRHSADAVAVACARTLRDVPDLPSDNALPRWLDEVAGYRVVDLARRRRLSVDLDSPLDLVLVGRGRTLPGPVADRLAAVRAVARDRRAELVVAGRTSAGVLRALERGLASRTRALVEERGLRAASRLAMRAEPGPTERERPPRPPRSVLGLVLDDRGPDALASVLAQLGDAAVVDTRVLLAHRLGADERDWPSPEDRYASDLLLPDRIADAWLRALTASALEATIPVLLGGHTLVGPGLPIAVGAR